MSEAERELPVPRALPAPPAVGRELIALLGDPEADPALLVRAIESDPLLCAATIRLLGKSPFAPRRPTSLHTAIALAGPRSARSAALALCVARTLRARPGSDLHDALWLGFLMKALAARRLAAATGDWLLDEAFLCGFVSGAGAAVLLDAEPRYRGILSRHLEGEGDLRDLERGRLETGHDALGARLLEGWGFPARLIAPIRQHFELIVAGGDVQRRAQILLGADCLARALTGPVGGELIGALPDAVAEQVGIPATRVASIAASLCDELRETAPAFALPTDRLRDWQELRGGAREPEPARPAPPPTPRPEPKLPFQLPDERGVGMGIVEAETFRQALDGFHRRARQLRKPLSLLVLSIYNLDDIVEAGGEVKLGCTVGGLAERVSALVRRSDTSAIIGRDLVAVLAPGCATRDLLSMALRVRAGVEREPVGTDDGSVGVQVAIGLAAASPQNEGLDPGALLLAARAAVDRASGTPERIHLAA